MTTRYRLAWAWRSQRHHRTALVASVFMLAAGAGTTTAVILSSESVYRGSRGSHVDADRIIRLYSGSPTAPSGDVRRYGRTSYPELREYAALSAVFQDVVGSGAFSASVASGGATESAPGELVTGNYFAALGVTAEVGRLIQPADDQQPGAGNVVVLSNAYWRSHFGGAPDVVGRTLRISGYPFTIVGVAPASFHGSVFHDSPALWTPASMQAQAFGTPWVLEYLDARLFDVLAVLRPGVTIAQARDAVLRRRAIRPDSFSRDVVPTMEPAPYLLGSAERTRNQLDQIMRLLIAAAILLYVIVGANLVSLVAARDAARRRDIAVQRALGASRRHIVGQQVCEQMLIALPAALLGALWAAVAIRQIARLPFLANTTLSHPGRNLLLTASLSVVTAIAVGIAAGWRATGASRMVAWRDAMSGAVANRALWRRGLTCVQIALALSVGFDAVLLARSVRSLAAKDTGYAVTDVAVGMISFLHRSDFEPRGTRQYDAFMQRLRDTPGVLDASTGSYEMLTENEPRLPVSIPGYRFSPGEDNTMSFETVGLRYFATLGIPFVAGRDFGVADTVASHSPIVINESAAARYWPGINPIGHTIIRNGTPLHIIGVVRDVSFKEIRDDHSPRYYADLRSFPYAPMQQVLYVRFAGPAESIEHTLERTVRDAAPGVPDVQWRTLAEDRDTRLHPVRLLESFVISLAILATALALTGLAGLSSFFARQRVREMGIRVALGATRDSIIRLLMVDASRLVVVGIVLGCAAAFATAQLAKAFLFGVSAFDPVSLLVCAGGVAACALAASFIPAYSCSHVDPLIAFKADG